jgi:hypothetical protein
MGRVLRQLKHGWNVFQDGERDFGQGAPTTMPPPTRGGNTRYFNDRSFVGSIFNRLAVDFSMVEFYHAKLDDQGVAIDYVNSPLNDCLTLDPNIDQTAFELKMDFAMSLFQNNHAAIVPVDATMDPLVSGSYDIKNLRIGRVVGWRPQHVSVEVYDDREVNDQGEPVNGGITKQVYMRKQDVGIVINPFFGIMNEPNGMLQRLLTKWALLDKIDELQGSEKLDIIFQLPYTVRGESRQKQAEDRRKALSDQLQNDPLGIGYIDVSEKVIQLNRPINNKLLEEIQDLANGVMSELGLTREIMNGTASRDQINNYYDRTIEPIATAFGQETKRKFLTKTARTQKQSIEYYRDPLKLIPIDELAEVSDKLIRNRVITVNEFRPKIGYRPSTEPSANKLENPNMPSDDQTAGQDIPPSDNLLAKRAAKLAAKQAAKEVPNAG